VSCPFCETCKAFELFKAEPRLDYLRWAFCHGEHTDCERYKKLVAGEKVTESFMPTGERLPVK
jgi:hypothetical protein